MRVPVRYFLLFTTALIVSFPVSAQQRGETQFHDHGTGFVNDVAELDRELKSRSMADRGEIVPNQVMVSFDHPDYLEDDQFAIRMTVPTVMSGCYDVSPLEYEASFIDPYYLDIKVKHYRIKTTPSSAPHMDCPSGYRQSEGVMVLNKSDLASRGTRQIKFRTDTVTEYYDLSMSEDVLTLKPQSMVVFKAPVNPDTQTISYDFSSPSKLWLYVPMAREGEDLRTRLEMFAQSNGLIVEPQQGSNQHMILVKDASGGLVSTVRQGGGVREMGAITVSRPFRGERGMQDMNVPLSVYAKPL